MKFYGLRDKRTKVPLEFFSERNCGDDCVDVRFELWQSDKPDRVWLVANRAKAVAILKQKESTPSYNADYDSPEFPDHLNRRNFEVFEVEI